MSTDQLHKKAETTITGQEGHSEFYDDSAPFYPLSKWEADGFDIEMIKKNTKPWNIRMCPVLGETYRVPILTTGKRGFRGTQTDSKVTMPAVRAAALPAPPASSLALTDRRSRDDKSSTSSASEKSSSTDAESCSSSGEKGKKRKKSTRARKAKSGKAKKGKDKKGKKETKEKRAKRSEPKESKAEKKAREARERKEAKEKEKQEKKGAAMTLKYAGMVSGRVSATVVGMDSVVAKPEFAAVPPVVQGPFRSQHLELTTYLNMANTIIAANGLCQSELPDMSVISGLVASAKRNMVLAVQLIATMNKAGKK